MTDSDPRTLVVVGNPTGYLNREVAKNAR